MEIKLSKIKQEIKKYRKLGEKKIEWRLYVLAQYKRAKNKALFLIKSEISERTYFRWKKAYLEKGPEGLRSKKGKGRKKNYIRGKLASKIKHYRKKYGWGAEVICAHINPGRKEKLSKYKVNRFLKEQGLIKTKKKKKKKKHDKTVVIKTPGEFTQIDVKHLTELHHTIKRYAYNFIDHASKWSYKKIYDSYGPYETLQFMEEVINICPFKILKEQSDNGIEFTNKFVSNPLDPKEHALDKFCRANGIVHKLIPPGEKELNGLVEKHHHLDYKEFYKNQKTADVEVLNKRLHKHCMWRNENRRYKSLNWKTPNEFLKENKKLEEAARAASSNFPKNAQVIDICNDEVGKIAA